MDKTNTEQSVNIHRKGVRFFSLAMISTLLIVTMNVSSGQCITSILGESNKQGYLLRFGTEENSPSMFERRLGWHIGTKSIDHFKKQENMYINLEQRQEKTGRNIAIPKKTTRYSKISRECV